MPPYYFDLLQVILHLKLLKTEKKYFFDPGAHHFLITFAGEQPINVNEHVSQYNGERKGDGQECDTEHSVEDNVVIASCHMIPPLGNGLFWKQRHINN